MRNPLKAYALGIMDAADHITERNPHPPNTLEATLYTYGYNMRLLQGATLLCITAKNVLDHLHPLTQQLWPLKTGSCLHTPKIPTATEHQTKPDTTTPTQTSNAVPVQTDHLPLPKLYGDPFLSAGHGSSHAPKN